jgi:hypothetical protein
MAGSALSVWEKASLLLFVLWRGGISVSVVVLSLLRSQMSLAYYYVTNKSLFFCTKFCPGGRMMMMMMSDAGAAAIFFVQNICFPQ